VKKFGWKKNELFSENYQLSPIIKEFDSCGLTFSPFHFSTFSLSYFEQQLMNRLHQKRGVL
jgi:hypothetical protein